jgi:DNA anti-recombination protein RmuC
MNAVRFTLPIAALLLVVSAPAGGMVGARTARTVFCESQDSDAYVLSLEKSFWSTNTSLERLQGLRERFAGDFLWVRRGSKAFLVRDPGTLRQVRALFDPLRSLDPDRAALDRLRYPLEARERALDREQETLDQEADRLSDRKQERAAGVREGLERRQRALQQRMRALEKEQEQFDALESSLEEREEALEKEAEGELWRLIDSFVARGIAKPID